MTSTNPAEIIDQGGEVFYGPEVVELAPDVNGAVPDAAALTTVKCRFCGEQFNMGRGSIAGRNRHEKKEHPEEWEKAKSARAGGRSQKKEPATPRRSAPRPRSSAGRQSAAEPLAMAVRGLSWLLARATTEETPYFGPMSLMLAFESDIAGAELDVAAAGSFVDRLALQPMVAAEDRFKRVGPLIAAPLLCGAIAYRPESYDELYPMLRWCLLPMLPALAAEMTRQAEQKKQMEAAAAELAELDPAFAKLFEGGGDPIDAIIARIFPAPADEPVEPAPIA